MTQSQDSIYLGLIHLRDRKAVQIVSAKILLVSIFQNLSTLRNFSHTLSYFYLGNVNENLDFQYGAVPVQYGCGVTFMNEYWYFGGPQHQVNIISFKLNVINRSLFDNFCFHVNKVFFMPRKIHFLMILSHFM